MEVVYIKNIQDKILDEIDTSRRLNKKIDYIKLTKDEAAQLFDYVDTLRLYWATPFMSVTERKCERIHNSMYYGVTLKVGGY